MFLGLGSANHRPCRQAWLRVETSRTETNATRLRLQLRRHRLRLDGNTFVLRAGFGGVDGDALLTQRATIQHKTSCT